MRSSLLSRSLAYLVLIVITFLSLVPTIYLIDVSFRNPVDSFSPALITPNPTIANYQTVFSDPSFLHNFLNSVIISLSAVMATILIAVFASFALSRIKIPARTLIFNVIISSLMIPFAALIVPLTVLLKNMGLLNNYLGLIGPFTAIGTPFGLLILKSAMDNFPQELEEAAIMDGADNFYILWRIIVPLIRPSLFVIGIWQFLYTWNEFFLALVVMTQPSMKTVSLVPLQFQGPYLSDPGALFAVLTLVSVIPMVVYAAMQKWFVGGLMEGSIKG
jgi:raffinose/stachyose/melibiose transport system permease protein